MGGWRPPVPQPFGGLEVTLTATFWGVRGHPNLNLWGLEVTLTPSLWRARGHPNPNLWGGSRSAGEGAVTRLRRVLWCFLFPRKIPGGRRKAWPRPIRPSILCKVLVPTSASPTVLLTLLAQQNSTNINSKYYSVSQNVCGTLVPNSLSQNMCGTLIPSSVSQNMCVPF